MTTDRRDLTRMVLDECAALGFAAAGICAAVATEHAAAIRGWLEAGKNGEMDYLARHLDKRLDPALLVDGARALICVADVYATGTADTAEDPPQGLGRIARYARGRDYHTVIKRRLHALCDRLDAVQPGATYKACVDTAPILEREHAQRAGIGATGKHTLLIDPERGSYLLLGLVVTTLDLEPSAAAPSDPCGTCTRCIDACPTEAITPWSVDATKCISYLTIEHRSPIDAGFHEAVGEWIFGCDICQEVCPHNQPTDRRGTVEPNPAYAPRRAGFDLMDVLNWTEDDRRAAFVTSAMKRARLDMMKRNALIVAANLVRDGGHAALRTRIAELAGDETEVQLVRETARDVLSGLS